jgi:hypothetical protein
MVARLERNYTVHDMRDEILYFDKSWKRSFSGSKAIYTATSHHSVITLTNTKPSGKTFPVVIQTYAKGSKVIVIGVAVHLPPHRTKRLV